MRVDIKHDLETELLERVWSSVSALGASMGNWIGSIVGKVSGFVMTELDLWRTIPKIGEDWSKIEVDPPLQNPPRK